MAKLVFVLALCCHVLLDVMDLTKDRSSGQGATISTNTKGAECSRKNRREASDQGV